MNTIKVKEVKGMLSDSGQPYYREKAGMPLLIQATPTEWCVCSKDGEPSHPVGKGFKVEVVK
jgi:hypothetical protein